MGASVNAGEPGGGARWSDVHAVTLARSGHAFSRSGRRDLRASWPLRTASFRVVGWCWLALFSTVTAVGLLIVHVLDDGPVGRLDRATAVYLEGNRTSLWNQMAQVGAGLADAYTLTPAVAVLCVVFVLRFRRWQDAVVLGFGLLVEKSVFIGATYLVGRERPPVLQLDGHPPTSSYPSGHVAAAVVSYGAIAVIVGWHSRSRLVRSGFRYLAGLAPATVAVSRLYLGMHHLTDVAVGAIQGACALLVIVWAVRVGTDELDRSSVPEWARRLEVSGRCPK